MAEKKLNMLANFPAVSTEEWKAKIVADLKGADFDKKLVWKTAEGFDVQPFYRAEDIENLQTANSAPSEFPFVRGTKDNNKWLVRQDIDAQNAVEANSKALDILSKGVNSLGFKIAKETLSAKFIEELLSGIQADEVELNFQICVTRAKELVKILADYFSTQKYNSADLQGSVNFDPINKMLLKGKKLNLNFIAELLVPLVKEAKNLPFYRVVNVNAVSLNNAGAYSTQELGYALAWGVQYLNVLIDNGIDACTAAKSIKFNFGVGGNYFMEIAKFRAARLLWAKIIEQYNPQCTCEDCNCMTESGLGFCPCAAKMKIHAQTSLFNMAIFDAHVNLLRSQTEAMSATIAGVDSLTVTPFDVVYKNADEFSERIARNQQLLLKEESHFDKVVDASAGSYYIENLTVSLAEQAWKLFLETEEKGFFNLTEKGEIQAEIRKTSEARLKNISSRREILLGTNQYPNFTETAAAKIDLNFGECGCNDGLETLPHIRAAQQFEELRLATERSGKRPKAFMLTIGSLAMRLARAQFSCNFFACAGYEVIDNLGFKSAEDGVAAAQKAGADIIVLCSSDDEYAELAPAAFKTIAGKQIFVVAGAPACMEDLQKAGIENFINVKTNVLNALKGYNAKLGIS
jgi:methylmalonyl-CoA mutase